MPRPCELNHPDLNPACPLCEAYRTRPEIRSLWDSGAARVWGREPPPGPENSRVYRCCGNGRWMWSVTRDGMTIAQGSEETEAEALEEANAVRA